MLAVRRVPNCRIEHSAMMDHAPRVCIGAKPQFAMIFAHAQFAHSTERQIMYQRL